jgi:crotonobetainyl-CoA:carnitine CoA-transferase CaiB-like acyl-CoA transferase
LLERGQTGQGQAIKVSLFDAMADWMTVPLLHQVYGGEAPQRIGLNHPSIAPYGIYSCRDGQLIIAIQNNREWQKFCEGVLHRPDMVQDKRYAFNVDRCTHRALLDAEINQSLESVNMMQLTNRLLEADIAFGRLNDVAGLASHPQLRRLPVETPQGTIEVVAPPVSRPGEETRLRPVPALGEHSELIREEFARPPDTSQR